MASSQYSEASVEKLGSMLVSRSLTLAVAESCTGGLIGAAVTSIAGSSRFFRGGVIAYDNTIKQRILGVPGGTLERFGAVSAETVEKMAQGVQGVFMVDCAISVSGIAGPGGGTPEKPVGLVYLGAAIGPHTTSARYIFNGDRRAIREQSVQASLNLLQSLIR